MVTDLAITLAHTKLLEAQALLVMIAGKDSPKDSFQRERALEAYECINQALKELGIETPSRADFVVNLDGHRC